MAGIEKKQNPTTQCNKNTKIYTINVGCKKTHIYTVNCKNCSWLCAYHCAQLLYTMQQKTVLIIFALNLQIATVQSTGGKRGANSAT